MMGTPLAALGHALGKVVEKDAYWWLFVGAAGAGSFYFATWHLGQPESLGIAVGSGSAAAALLAGKAISWARAMAAAVFTSKWATWKEAQTDRTQVRYVVTSANRDEKAILMSFIQSGRSELVRSTKGWHPSLCLGLERLISQGIIKSRGNWEGTMILTIRRNVLLALADKPDALEFGAVQPLPHVEPVRRKSTFWGT